MKSVIKESRYVPSTCNGHRDYDGLAEVFYTVGAVAGKFFAIAYSGKRGKKDWYFSFKTEEKMQEYIEDYFKRIVEANNAKVKRKVEQKEANANMTVKVGDIFVSSWGYDQTNVDFYQVTEVIGKSTVIVHAINSEAVEGTSGHMCCHVKPVKDSFATGYKAGSEKKRVTAGYKGEPTISFKYHSGRLVKEGETFYCSWYA